MRFSRDNRPQRMWRNGRDPIVTFGLDERLYYRFSPGHVASDKLYPPLIPLRFPDASVNRGMLSRPIDVLIPDLTDPKKEFPEHKVAWITARHFPFGYHQPTGEIVELVATHDPTDCNFAHSEIRTHIGGRFDRNVAPHKTV